MTLEKVWESKHILPAFRNVQKTWKLQLTHLFLGYQISPQLSWISPLQEQPQYPPKLTASIFSPPPQKKKQNISKALVGGLWQLYFPPVF